MSNELYLRLDPIGGIAGDMFCAALLDAFPEHLDGLRSTIAALGPPQGWSVELDACTHPLRGSRFNVRLPNKPALVHRTWGDIRSLLEGAAIAAGVKKQALAIFGHLAQAEATVHGMPIDEVHFHEVGDWDSIIDIVGAAFLIDRLGVVSASCRSLPLGGGTVSSMHGILPVPAPATLRLLEGFPWHDDGVIGERVTPTGAAIVRSLVKTASVVGTLCAHGIGFGTRSLGLIPNCLQVLCLEATQPPSWERLIELAFDVDDQTPEDLAHALDRLRTCDGVLDLHTIPAVGKAGRLTHGVRLLLRPERLQSVIDACFRETTTIGLRWHGVERVVLPRHALDIEVEGRKLEVKVVKRPGGDTAKVEARSLLGVSGMTERQRLRDLGRERALGKRGSDE